jgi:hypothetical protein
MGYEPTSLLISLFSRFLLNDFFLIAMKKAAPNIKTM